MAYTGTFVRQALGDTPNGPRQGSCSCPDILLAGKTDPGPAGYATAAAYTQMTPSDVWTNIPNYVYLRGYQSGTTNGSNIFFYSVPSNLALWPANWSADGVYVGSVKTPQNWAWAPPTEGNPIVVTEEALVWTPSDLDPNVAHWCTVAWADNSTEDAPKPPDLSRFSNYSSFDELMYFLSLNPNMGWRNTTDYHAPPPDASYSTSVETKDSPETVYITVCFCSISTGTFMVNVTGDVTYTSGPDPIDVSHYLGGFPVNYGGGLQFEANQTAELIVTYNVTTDPLGPLAYIGADVTHPVTPSMMDKLTAATPPGVALPISLVAVRGKDGLESRPMFTLGRQQWNLKFASKLADEVGDRR